MAYKKLQILAKSAIKQPLVAECPIRNAIPNCCLSQLCELLDDGEFWVFKS